MPLRRERPDARPPEPLLDEGLLRRESVEVIEGAKRLARILPEEHRTDALPRIGRERVRVVEHNAPLRERVDAR